MGREVRIWGEKGDCGERGLIEGHDADSGSEHDKRDVETGVRTEVCGDES